MPRGIPSLTAEQKQVIFQRIKENGECVPDLAKEFGVSRQSLYYTPKLPTKDMALKKDIERVMMEHATYRGYGDHSVTRRAVQTSKTHIFHSDQGSEYRSNLFLQTLQLENISPSMSAKASLWQNGYKESFYLQFKLELGHPDGYPTMGELIEVIALQIYYYNTLTHPHRAYMCAKCVCGTHCN